MNRSQTLITAICLIAIYLLSVFVRIEIRKSAEAKEGDLPFTMESAFLYYFSNLLAQGNTLNDMDFKAQAPEGFEPDSKISLTLDTILVFIYRLFFKFIPYIEFLKIAQNCFIPVSIFIAFFITYHFSKNSLSGIWASLIYGLSISSIVRSTGIEYSRENFALPLIFLHFALISTRQNLFKSILSASTLALSLMIWDGTQVYFILWVLYELFKFLFSSSPSTVVHSPQSTVLIIHFLILLPCALIHPYLKDHQFLYSPGMMGLYALCIGYCVDIRWRKKIFILTLPFFIFCWLISPYFEIYEHMINLILYKIKYMGIKPTDPSLLPFDVRMLWTPALHSSPLHNITRILPWVMLSIPASWVHGKAKNEASFFFLFFYMTSFILYLAFVRLEVYLIFFLACLISSAPFGFDLQRSKKALIWNSCIFLALLLGAKGITKDISRFERPVLYSHLEAVTNWIKENTSGNSIVLANFGLSPSILAYGQRGIILHPKYESKDMREKIREFAYALFDNSENRFYSYCLKNKADYYVHAVGTYQDRSSYSWAYMVDKLQIKQNVSAARFEFNLPMRSFYIVSDYNKYRIYKVIKPSDVEKANVLKKAANESQTKEAEELYIKALEFNPNDPMIYFNLSKIYNQSGRPELAIQATKEGLRKAVKSDKVNSV